MNKSKPDDGSGFLLVWGGVMLFLALGASLVGAVSGEDGWYAFAVIVGLWGLLYTIFGAAIRD